MRGYETGPAGTGWGHQGGERWHLIRMEYGWRWGPKEQDGNRNVCNVVLAELFL